MKNSTITVFSALFRLQGIGDSGQGITNALIFLFFTNKFKEVIRGLYYRCSLSGGGDMNIQTTGNQNGSRSTGANIGEDKSLLDSTSVDNVSPHNFTYQSYEHTTTPLEVSLENN